MSQLRAAAEEIVTPEYAQGINASVVEDGNAVVLVFPDPKEPPDCFFVLIRKTGDEMSYLTYEKTLSLYGAESFVGVVGAWMPGGIHGNQGGRTYSDVESFLEDVKPQP